VPTLSVRWELALRGGQRAMQSSSAGRDLAAVPARKRPLKIGSPVCGLSVDVSNRRACSFPLPRQSVPGDIAGHVEHYAEASSRKPLARPHTA
jgi:hypothetical protein